MFREFFSFHSMQLVVGQVRARTSMSKDSSLSLLLAASARHARERQTAARERNPAALILLVTGTEALQQLGPRISRVDRNVNCECGSMSN